MKILLLLCLIIFISCQQSGGENDQQTPLVDLTQDQEQKKCETTKVLKIDGNLNITSLMASKTNKVILWNFNNKQILSEVSSIKSFYRFSKNSKYFLRKYSKDRYQVYSTSESGTYSEPLTFAGDAYSVKFDKNSEFVYGSLKSRRSRFTNFFFTFDIKNKKVSFLTQANPIVESDFYDASLVSLVTSRGQSNKLISINTETNEKRVHRLLNGKVFDAYFSLNNLVLKTKTNFLSYDKITGEYLNYLSVKHIYDIDYESNIAFALKGKDTYQLIDLYSHKIVDEFFIPTSIEPSSCKIIEGEKNLLCLSKALTNRVIKFDTSSGQTTEKCI